MVWLKSSQNLGPKELYLRVKVFVWFNKVNLEKMENISVIYVPVFGSSFTDLTANKRLLTYGAYVISSF